MSQPLVGLVATICGALFIGYCIYFDRKRRSDPNFRRELRRRRRANQARPLTDTEITMEKLFISHFSAGQDCILNGDLEGGVEHLAIGVLVSNQPIKILKVLRQYIPQELFTVLLRRIQVMQNNGTGPPPVTSFHHSLHATVNHYSHIRE